MGEIHGCQCSTMDGRTDRGAVHNFNHFTRRRAEQGGIVHHGCVGYNEFQPLASLLLAGIPHPVWAVTPPRATSPPPRCNERSPTNLPTYHSSYQPTYQASSLPNYQTTYQTTSRTINQPSYLPTYLPMYILQTNRPFTNELTYLPSCQLT